MSAWWSLPQAAPILLRHLLAYAELAEEDLQRFSQRATARLFAVLVALLGAIFMLFMVCVAVIAAAWDTPHRMTAIFWLLGSFTATTLLALLAALKWRKQASLFESVKKEWSQDRVILDRLLADGQQRSTTVPSGESERPS